MDTNQDVEAMRAKVAEYDATRGNGAMGGWGAQRPAAPTGQVIGVNVPIKLDTPDGGTIRLYLILPADAAASPDALMSALGALAAAGVPLDVYHAKPEGGGWGGGGGQRNGGARGACFNCGRQGHMASECRQPGGGGSRGGNGGGWGQRRGGW